MKLGFKPPKKKKRRRKDARLLFQYQRKGTKKIKAKLYGKKRKLEEERDR